MRYKIFIPATVAGMIVLTGRVGKVARKIWRGMTYTDAIRILGENNQEAEKICRELYRRAPRIDPDDFTDGWGALRDLDTLGIRGRRLLAFFRICREDVGVMLAVMMAWQLGIEIARQEDIDRAIENRGDGLDLDAIVQEVQTELPSFNPAA
jgi:hypothetical protein